MGVLGVLSGLACQPHHSIAVDPDEAFGLADPVTFDQVLEDGDGLLRGQAGAEQRGALAFGEAGVARLAVEQAEMPQFSPERSLFLLSLLPIERSQMK